MTAAQGSKAVIVSAAIEAEISQMPEADCADFSSRSGLRRC
jgi:ribosome-binding ATPase YchF (GTP1/OBG family)